MQKKVKICGINSVESAPHAEAEGADFIGFIFFLKSPRNISFTQAVEISEALKTNIKKVAVTVNASDDEIARIIANLKPDYIQLHGTETPERAEQIKQKFDLKIIKAIGIAESADLQKANEFANIADYILFDATPPKNSELPGGNAISFDWKILDNSTFQNFTPNYNWILSGGLTPENVADAIKITGANFVDVASGVERAKGLKDLQKISDFISNVKK